jgi:tetratricopeptide (TPR) repeat protein
MLIVLDNARDAAQLRPLLPGAPGCLVLVTSRHQLPGLVAGEGAHPLPLGLLSADDARGLLAQRVGVDRTEGEPDAVSEIIDHCGGLPLALVIIAARAAMSGNLPLAVLARQLRDDGDRLDALATGDPGTDLRSVFSWSYRVLDADAARLFRLLGVHPGPQISVPAAASLAALTVPTVRRLLAELVRANLVAELDDGRYSLHDLLRTFAAELARPLDGNHSRRAAIRRMLDHYLHSAAAADRLSRPARDPLVLEPPAFGVVPESPPDLRDALRWFTVERTVLIAAVELASTVSARHAWQLAWSLSTFLDLRGHWDELIGTQHTAIAAAQRAADPGAQAGAHRLLARAYTRKRRIDDADVQLLRALDLYRGAGDRNGESHTHLNLALLRERQGRYPEALDHARRSLKIFESAGDQYGQACAHNAVGWYHALLGDHPMALRHCRQALARMQALGDRVGQASTWDSIGYAHHHLGQHPRALADFQQALDLYRDLGDRHLEGFVLVHIGDTHDAVGDAEAARSSWEEALGILDDLDQPEAEKLRAKLAASTPALAVAHRRT